MKKNAGFTYGQLEQMNELAQQPIDTSSSQTIAKPNVSRSYSWVSVIDKLPQVEGYYRVRFINGDEEEKPFRIRLSKNIKGFMTMEEVTHWSVL